MQSATAKVQSATIVADDELKALAKRLIGHNLVTKVPRKEFDEVMYHICHLVGHSINCETGNQTNFNTTQWTLSAAIYLCKDIDWCQVIYDALRDNIMAYNKAKDKGAIKYRTHTRFITYLMTHLKDIRKIMAKNRELLLTISKNKLFTRSTMKTNFRFRFGNKLYKIYLAKDPHEPYESPSKHRHSLPTASDDLDDEDEEESAPAAPPVKGKGKGIAVEPAAKKSSVAVGIKFKEPSVKHNYSVSPPRKSTAPLRSFSALPNLRSKNLQSCRTCNCFKNPLDRKISGGEKENPFFESGQGCQKGQGFRISNLHSYRFPSISL